MNEIWVKRLIAGTKLFSEVPESRKEQIKEILQSRLTEEIFNDIINR